MYIDMCVTFSAKNLRSWIYCLACLDVFLWYLDTFEVSKHYEPTSNMFQFLTTPSLSSFNTMADTLSPSSPSLSPRCGARWVCWGISTTINPWVSTFGVAWPGCSETEFTQQNQAPYETNSKFRPLKNGMLGKLLMVSYWEVSTYFQGRTCFFGF